MKMLSWILVGLFVASPLLAADPVVILRDDGTYVLSPTSNTLVKVVVVDQRTGTTPPGPNPPPPPPPGGSTVEQTAERLARDVNRTDEAAVLGAIYAFFTRELTAGSMKSADAAKVIRMARNVALAGTRGEDRWKSWGESIDGLMGSAPTAGFFADVKVGLAKAAGVDPGVFDKVSNVTTGAEYAESNAAPAGFDWTMIFQIIMQIIQLLRDLGILG